MTDMSGGILQNNTDKDRIEQDENSLWNLSQRGVTIGFCDHYISNNNL